MLRAVTLAILWSMMMTRSLGFTMDRTALISSSWDTAPSLETYQRVLVDPALNGRTQATGMDKILRAKIVDARTSTGLAESRARAKRSTTENIGTGMKPVGDGVSAAKEGVSVSSDESASAAVAAPRNVILLLVDERGQDERKEENPWKGWMEKLPYAIEGSLQSCRDKIEAAGLSSGNTFVPESKGKDCDCERSLRTSIAELLFWARNTRGMTTGAVSDSNFSIPSFPGYQISNGVSTELDAANESDAKSELRKSKRDSNDAWQTIDLGDRARSVPTSLASERKTEGATNYDVTWDIFDVFSKIRMAFFRSLLESLGRNDGAFEDREFSPGGPFPVKPTVTNLIGNTIRELKSIPNDKGYMLIAAALRNESDIAVDLLQREGTTKDTLLVATRICSGDMRSIPFVAQGPNNQILREARTISELPAAIRRAIANDCHDPGCANRQRRDIPIVSSVPIKITFQELPARKRVIRDQGTEKPDNAISTEETAATETEKQGRSSSSSSPETTPYSLGTALGVATSVLAMSALTSS